jgi:maltooligosyltrehalose trehalohydrolase
MLFMGEEAAAETPFFFFCDWHGQAADLTRDGRRKEFAHFASFSTPEMRHKIPDPAAEKTYQAQSSIGPQLNSLRAARSSVQ